MSLQNLSSLAKVITSNVPTTEKSSAIKKIQNTPSSSPSGSSSSGGLSYSYVSPKIMVSGIGTTNINLMQPGTGSTGVKPIEEKPKDKSVGDYINMSLIVADVARNRDKLQPQNVNEDKTSAFIQFGYKPNDPDYQTIYSDITAKQKDISMSRKQIPSSIISVIKSEPGTTFTFDDTGKEYTKKETLGKLTSNLFGSMKTSAQLRSYKKNIEKYEAGGYNINLTDTGVSFSEPSVEEVFKWKYGDSALGTSRLIAGSAMELGIPALFSGAASLVTRDSKYWENEVNRQREKALNLSIHKGETGTDVLKYAGRFWTSPESVESFWLPVATLSVGYAYTGIKAGATGAVTTGRLALTGAKYGSKIVNTMDKVLLGAGVVGSVTSGASIGSSFAYENAGMLPKGSGITAVGKTATGWTLAAGGFMTGQSLYMNKYTAPISSTPKINTKDIYTISNRDVMVENVPGHKGLQVFASNESPFVQISKQGMIKGTSQITGISAKSNASDISFSKGLLTVRSSWGSRFGTKFSNTKFIDVTGRSVPIGKPSGNYQGYFDQAIFTDRGTGLKTYSYGRSIVGATGKNITFRTPVYSTKNLTLFDNPVKFSEYESLSLGKFRVSGKDIGMGMDYSKIYLRDITGSFGGGNSGRGIVIGGGSVLTGGGTIGTLYGGGVKLGSVTSTIPATGMRSSPVTGTFVSGGSASGVTSSISIPSYAGGGLVSIPKTVSLSNSKYIQSPKLSSIISPVVISVQKTGSIQSPVTIQDYRKMNTLDSFTIPMSTYEFKTSTLQSPINIVQPRVDYKRANLLATANLGILKTELKTVNLVTPTMASKIVDPVIPKLSFWFPLELGGGGYTPSKKRNARSRYKFREFNVPSFDKMFKIKGDKKKYGI